MRILLSFDCAKVSGIPEKSFATLIKFSIDINKAYVSVSNPIRTSALLLQKSVVQSDEVSRPFRMSKSGGLGLPLSETPSYIHHEQN
ncbi:hypothetical protein J6590_092004 [Homalodisca vitripennis]|nr:hypothetical protein J6590_092004 [Homalodisca vitripennis]